MSLKADRHRLANDPFLPFATDLYREVYRRLTCSRVTVLPLFAYSNEFPNSSSVSSVNAWTMPCRSAMTSVSAPYANILLLLAQV